jgi:hypothetical protein
VKNLEFKNSFGNTYLSTVFEPDHQWIYNKWSGSLSVDNVVKGATGVLKILEANKCSHILNDNRHVIGSWNQANEWIEQEWMPKALTMGLARFAHVLPNSIFVKASAEEMLVRVGDKFEMKLFEDINEAQNWLKDHITIETAF